jgi:ABC-type transport system involved in multi-copper enzyme maturation permease subunit
MNWLLWREYRLNRLILITAVVLLLLPYVVVLMALPWVKWPANEAARNVAFAFGFAAVYSLVIAQLTVALLAGNAMAGERADRSAEFIAYLPVPRTRRLVSKLSLAFAATAVIWGANLLVLLLVGSLEPELWRNPLDPGISLVLSYTAITGLTFFGVGWLISSFQSSPTFAVCGGLITPLLVVMGLSAVAWLIDVPRSNYSSFLEIGYVIICLLLAIMCFSIGTWYYLNRDEP